MTSLADALEPIVTANAASPTLENIESPDTPKTDASESDMPIDATISLEKVSSLENLKVEDALESILMGNSINPLEQLPPPDGMEFKPPTNSICGSHLHFEAKSDRSRSIRFEGHLRSKCCMD